MGLRKGQRELVESYTGGLCAVPAIPGGGKTYSLTMWAAETIGRGLHRPGKLLIVTYMNSAVSNFRRRISQELKGRGIGSGRDFHVATIHGLCLRILKERPDFLMAGDGLEVADEVTRARIIDGAVEEWKERNAESFQGFLDPNLQGNDAKLLDMWSEKLALIVRQSAVGDFKLRGLRPEAALKASEKLSQASLLRCAAEIYEIYEARLKRDGYLDFDDMLYGAKKLLEEDRELLERYRKKYTFVCEDEAQDSNLIQNEVLSMIAEGNLLRVGDSNQAICGTFTNSDFTYFRDFCRKPETMIYSITQSSRSSEAIIGLANRFVERVRSGHPVPSCRGCLLPQFIEPVGEGEQPGNPPSPPDGLGAGIFNSWEAEAAAVVSRAAHFLRKMPDKTIAVLVPTWWRLEVVLNLLEARGIPYEAVGGTEADSGALRRLGRALDFASMPENGDKLRALLPEMLEEEASERLSALLDEFSVRDALYNTEGTLSAAGLTGTAKTEALGLFDILRRILEYPFIIPEKLILFISEALGFGSEDRAVAARVADEVRRMAARDPSWELGALAVELLSPRNAFTHFAGIMRELKGYEPEPGKITVSTYHRAKGLEWDVVFLTCLSSSDFPARLEDRFIGEYWFLSQEFKNPQAVLKAELSKALGEEIPGDPVHLSRLENISEKARLLYVGITRARQYLFLSGFHENPGKRNEIRPSDYLLELKKYIDRAAGEVRR